MLLKLSLVLLLTTASAAAFAQKNYSVSSPDKATTVEITVSDSIYYSVTSGGKALVNSSALTFRTDVHAAGWKVSKATKTATKTVLTPAIWQKSSSVADEYAQLQLAFSNGLALEWRTYNNGVAWRWISTSPKAYKVLDEQDAIRLPEGARAWYPEESGFFSHNERAYKKYAVSDIDAKKLASLPVLFDVGGTKIVLTESNLYNYAGMWVIGDGKGGVRATFPHAAKTKEIQGDRTEKVTSTEPYIAAVTGAQQFPWRILMIAKDDKDILINQLPMLLGKPAEGDYSWVRPGKVQWDWWHYNNIYGVDFRAGINNDTYKYYIDFAAKYGIEYVLLDEGWCNTRDLMDQAEGINVEELAKYAKSKNVDLLLWTSWLVLDKELDVALDTFAEWGIKGIKVDFMQRDDQDMVNYYEKISKAAAKRKLLVDFHGAYKPTGWLRSYPNVLTSEGVLGNEISKFAGSVDPEHTTTIPFIRMAAGPMDFTPGGMWNVQKKSFAANPSEPMTLGTRCNQLAMYVIYESPLQMLSDLPTHYYEQPDCMKFLKEVPTVWKNTVPLHAKIGEYVAMARQAKDDRWYIGAMSNWTARELELDLSFLGEGTYTMQVWKDGINADRNAKDFKLETLNVTRSSKVPVKMTTGGGYAAILTKN